MTGRLLTTREVAELLGLSPKSVLRRWRAGELPGYRLGGTVLRFEREDLDAYLRARRSRAAAPTVRPIPTEEESDA
jgi:excisionase family DNA binding protein